MQDVQISIPDRAYAKALSRLLTADGNHRVHLISEPNSNTAGVVVVDESIISCITLSEGIDLSRCIVFTRNEHINADRLWEVGLRHLIHADCPPSLGRLVIVAAEMRLKAGLAREQTTSDRNEVASDRSRKVKAPALKGQRYDLRRVFAAATWKSKPVATAMKVLTRSMGESAEALPPELQVQPEDQGISMFNTFDKRFLQRMGIREI